MSDSPSSALVIHQEVSACISTAQKISLLHTSKEIASNFKLLSEPESLEVLGTVNLTKTTLSPYADANSLSLIMCGEEDPPLFHSIVQGIMQTLSSMHDLLCAFTTATSSTWRDKKIKIFREDFVLRQKVDQFVGLYSNCQNNEHHPNKPNAFGADNKDQEKPWLHWITDEEGKQFWRSNFGEKRAVLWETFVVLLEQSQKSDAPLNLKDDEFFKAIIDFTHDGYVSTFEFGVFLKWFGPFEACYARMHNTFKSGILCGAVPGVEANMLLEGKTEGYYLIRFSKTQPGAFALTFVDTTLQTKHCLLHHSMDPIGFTLKNPPAVHNSLDDFVACYKNKLKYSISATERKSLSKSTSIPLSPRGYSQPNTDNLCIVCMDAVTNTVFLECGHVACCSVCAKALTSCPVCRRPIARVVQIFRP